MLLSNHAALHRRPQSQDPYSQQGQNAPQVSPQDAKQYYDIYQQATGGPTSTEQLFGGGDNGGLLSNLFGGSGAAAGPGLLSAVPGGAGYGSATGGAAHSMGVAAVPGGVSNAAVTPASSGGMFGAKGGSGAAGAEGAGAAGGGSAMGALGGLGALAAAAYLGYQHGEATQDRWAEEFANDPNAQAGKKFAEDYPGAFTNEGVPAGVDVGKVPFYSSMAYNPVTRRMEMKNEPGLSMADFNARDERRRQKERGD